ncbi:MAG: lactate racemase domain-containing protein [Bacillota bacterium]|nr:lactate racemase domain-containing protein [Bacillota bacterium]
MFEPIEVKIEGGYDIELPTLVPVKQLFSTPKVDCINAAVAAEFAKKEISALIKPGEKIAVAVGSRGIANLKEIVLSTITNIKNLGAEPFIVPAMASHGGATAEGQVKLLAEYGVTAEAMGVPIASSMETVELGRTSSGVPVYFDKNASEADGVVIIARVKPHTDFKGPFESGLMKMLAIGLGKHKGATHIHSLGFDSFHTVIPEVGSEIIAKAKIKLGVAALENAYDETARIEAVPASNIYEREPGLLEEAKSYMGSIIPRNFDVLIIEEIGKDISGAGMDPNIVGRPGSKLEGFNGPEIQKLVVFDLTKKTKGNACGIGMADVTTRHLVNQIDFSYLYINSITSTVLDPAKIPVTMNTEKEALVIALKTCNRIAAKAAKIVFIKNTLELDYIYVSEPLLEELKAREDVQILGEPQEITFNEVGRLTLRPSLISI